MTIPDGAELDQVQVGPDHGDGERQLAGLVQDRQRHVLLETEEVTQQHEQRNNTGTARIQRTGHEVRRECRHMPARHDRHGKVRRYDGVHRHRERNQEAGHEQIGLAEIAPLAVITAPAQ